MSKLVYLCLCVAILFSFQLSGMDEELEKKSTASVSKGVTYLLESQNEDGSWGKSSHPGIAALCLMAIHDAPGVDVKLIQAVEDKGVAFLMKHVQKNGSIFPKTLHEKHTKESAFYPNYTTSLSLLALVTLNRPEHKDIMVKARKYLMSIQFTDKSKVDFGGIGYGKTGRADLSNGGYAAEALYYTEHLDREPYTTDKEAPKRSKEVWNKLNTFLNNVQNLPEVNKSGYCNKDAKEGGGHYYRPNESKAGEADDGGPVSSASMTCVGLKTLLYAMADKNDIRVKSAMEYLMRNYVLSENPGMGLQGLYYYLHAMTKALDMYGEEELVDKAGKKHAWREDVLKQFLTMQKKDGSWVNSNGRFFESDPTLATPYAVIAMKIALKKGNLKKVEK